MEKSIRFYKKTSFSTVEPLLAGNPERKQGYYTKIARTNTLGEMYPPGNACSSIFNSCSAFQKPRPPWKAKDLALRDTDDSFRHARGQKKVRIEDFVPMKLLGKGKHGTVFLVM
jgi:hypothetical protein